MTTITVVRKGGLAAIAADTLTKYGYTKESAEYVVNHGKILKVGSSYIGLTGTVMLHHAVEIYFSGAGAKAKLTSVLDIFAAWNELHRVLKDEYYLNAHAGDDDVVEPSRVSAVIANPHGIFGVSVRRSVQEFTKFYSDGSGAEYAQGAMYAAYDEGRTAEEVARLGVRAAAEFDEDTGLPVDSFVVKLRKG
jgi:ATP-dependent protease HslVU (ClpYQ) peptidase subunit